MIVLAWRDQAKVPVPVSGVPVGIGLVGGLGLSSQRGLLDDARQFGKWGSL